MMVTIRLGSITCCNLSYKIRFEALKRQQGKERDKVKMLWFNFDYKSTSYWIEKSTTKAISLVDKIGNMLQRQIVVKALGKQIDIEYPAYTKYDAGTSFQSI